ncbi:hypothetical protein GCM10027037_34270 [Mucilaginibacter koreensis]
MKKVWWTALLLIFVIAAFIPYQQQTHILIKKKYNNVYSLLLKPDLWQKWNPQLKAEQKREPPLAVKISKRNMGFDIDVHNINIIVNINGFGFDVKKQYAFLSLKYSFTILPATNTRYTDVELFTVSSLFKNIVGWMSNSSSMNDMKSLKQYIENDDAYYGYNIDIHNAIDTLIAVNQKPVPARSRNNAIINMKQELQTFIKKNKLKVTQPVMADIRPLSQDSIRVMIGFSVNKAAKGAESIRIMKISGQAKVAVITYDGKYGNRQSAYNTLKSYLRDYDLLAPEILYEKYLNNKIPLNDNEDVHMQIIAPLQ